MRKFRNISIERESEEPSNYLVYDPTKYQLNAQVLTPDDDYASLKDSRLRLSDEEDWLKQRD